MAPTLRMRAAMAELPRLTGWVDERVAALGLEEHQAYALRLCIEELAGNVLLHGQAGSLHVTVEGTPLRLTIADDGAEFDPCGVAEPARPNSLDDAQPGGLGLMLTRRWSRGIGYAREAGWNRVTVAF